MDFWKYLADGKGLFLPEELDLPVDNSMRNRNKATGHEFGGTSNYPYESNPEAPGNTELGFHDPIAGIRKSYSVDRSGEALSDSYTEVAYTPSKVVSREKQSGQRMSGFLMESHSLEFETAVDLKLGRLADTQGARSIEFSDERQDMCSTSSVPSLPAKRTRITSLSSQNPYCQVEGCNKDLSCYKDYYKRHKVCDAHTKTAIVVVNGIQQRFCQQCSRFHLLAEFDDGKRSCRKRLANHNERRRKPQGAKFGSSSLGASFVCQGMLPPTSFSFPGKHGSGRWIDGHAKFKEPTTSNPTRFLDFRCSGKGPDDISLAMIGDEMVSFDVPGGSVQNLSSAHDSSTCALSLLSSESHRNSNTDLLGAPMGRSNQNHQSTIQGLTPSQHSLDGFGAEMDNPGDGAVVGPNNVMKMKHNEGGVVDLFQLSSHLQRVENKRNLLH